MVGVASDSDRTSSTSLRSQTNSGLVALWRSLSISEGGMPLNLFAMMDFRHDAPSDRCVVASPGPVGLAAGRGAQDGDPA